MKKQFIATVTTPLRQSSSKLFRGELPAWKAMADFLRTCAKGSECQVMSISPIDSPAVGERVEDSMIDWDSAVSMSGVYVAGEDEIGDDVWKLFEPRPSNTFEYDIMWYCVQIGSDFASDCGALSKDVALRMAREEAMEHPYEEVSLASVSVRDDYCFAVKYIQERGEAKSWDLDDLDGYGHEYEVKNASGYRMNFYAAMKHADADVLECVYEDLVNHLYLCEDSLPTAQELLDAYEEAHVEKFGEPWFLSASNPTW